MLAVSKKNMKSWLYHGCKQSLFYEGQWDQVLEMRLDLCLLQILPQKTETYEMMKCW